MSSAPSDPGIALKGASSDADIDEKDVMDSELDGEVLHPMASIHEYSFHLASPILSGKSLARSVAILQERKVDWYRARGIEHISSSAIIQTDDAKVDDAKVGDADAGAVAIETESIGKFVSTRPKEVVMKTEDAPNHNASSPDDEQLSHIPFQLTSFISQGYDGEIPLLPGPWSEFDRRKIGQGFPPEEMKNESKSEQTEGSCPFLVAPPSPSAHPKSKKVPELSQQDKHSAHDFKASSLESKTGYDGGKEDFK